MKSKFRLNKVFPDGVDVVGFVGKADMASLGGDIGDKPGVMVHITLTPDEWNSWVHSNVAPKAFNEVEFTASSAEFVPNKDPAKNGWWRINGFMPVGIGEGEALPDFETLLKRSDAAHAKDNSPAQPKTF